MTGIHTGGRSPIFSKMAGNLLFLSVYWQISTGYLQVYLPQVFPMDIPTDTGTPPDAKIPGRYTHGLSADILRYALFLAECQAIDQCERNLGRTW